MWKPFGMILSMKVDYKQFTVKLSRDEVSDLRDFSQLDTSMDTMPLPMLGLINQILHQDFYFHKKSQKTIMSTNSNIGIRYENGKIDSIYCHWDGYPEYNGRILNESYNKLEKVQELIELGDISSLKVTPRLTVAYHRDHDEPLCVTRDCCEDEFKDQQYSYLFDVVENCWFFSEEGGPFIKYDTTH